MTTKQTDCREAVGAIVTIVEHNRQQRERNKSFAEGWEAGYQAAWQHQADKWQPIETAPKDGSEIFIYPEYRAASWDDNYGWSNEDAEEFIGVTHWMPLPQPPQQQSEGK